MQKLLGVVMCGGQSTRMGTDKGLIISDGLTWAQHAFNKLLSLNIPVIVSINTSQTDAYSNIFDPKILVTDAAHIPGPLNGILSAHAKHLGKDLLILACDVIAMEYATLHNLVNTYQTQPGFNFYTYHNGRFFEPLCAIYTSSALNQLQQTDLSNYTLQKILGNGSTKSLEVIDGKVFKNQNSRE